MKNAYVITGGPGSGKTSLIKSIQKSGLTCNEEFSRGVIKEQEKLGTEALPWRNKYAFHDIVLGKMLDQYGKLPENGPCFLDRGIPDLIAYFEVEGFHVPDKYYEAACEHPYGDKVFLLPPWKKIYKMDEQRKETFERSVRIHEFLDEVYSCLDYEVIEVPKVSVKERRDFVLDII
mgnify:CR=1 FL=1